MDPAVRQQHDEGLSDGEVLRRRAACPHPGFVSHVSVTRLCDTGRYMAELRINCVECGVPMEFQGLPLGLNFRGATVSVDGQEATLAILPQGQAPTPLDLLGFTIRGRPS